MTSCAGTSMVIVRRSIRTTRSTMGMIKKIPGPLGGLMRPSRKMTPRWYSGKTLIADDAMMISKTTTMMIIIIVVVLLIIIASSAIKVFPEYQRGVIFRLGRINPPKGPGIFLIIPIVDRVVRIDLRTITFEVPAQEVITKDNVPAKVNAVAYFRVVDPSRAVVEVQNYVVATSQIAQTTLRSVLGQSDLDNLLTERDKLNARLQEIIDEQTEPWGIKVSIVEIKDVEIPQGMQRAMARQAEAERERRAKVIAAEGVPGVGEALAGRRGVVQKPGRDPVAVP